MIEPARIDLPLKVAGKHKSVKQVACGRAHSLFLTDEGGMYKNTQWFLSRLF